MMRQIKRKEQRWVLGEYLIELADLLKDGVSLREGLDLIASATSSDPIERALHQVSITIAEGGDFALALESAFPSLPRFCTEIIRQAKKERNLPAALMRLGEYMQDMQSLVLKKSSITKMLIYPISLSVIGLFILTILMIFVIPQFEALFEEFGTELPAITRSLIEVSAFLADFWLLLVSIVVLIYLIWRFIFSQFQITRRIQGLMLLQMPLFNSLYRLSVEAQLLRTLGLLGEKNIDHSTVMEAAEQSLASGYARDEIIRVKERVKTGSGLAGGFANCSLFSQRFIRILCMIDRQGMNQGLLIRQAERNKRKINDAPNLNRFLEPALIAIMGVFIGYLVVAMYLPIFQIGAVM